MYEAATVEDIYDAYQHFHFDDEHLFTCVGTSGKVAPPRCVGVFTFLLIVAVAQKYSHTITLSRHWRLGRLTQVSSLLWFSLYLEPHGAGVLSFALGSGGRPAPPGAL